MRFTPAHTVPVIACCNCGRPMESKGLAMCADCIRLTVDITEGIDKSGDMTFCKECGRLSNPPNQWQYAPPESRELLAACLRRLKGLNKVKLLDARFIWTEPHSRRIKIKVKVQGEASEFQGTLVQQSFEVEFVQSTAMCPSCMKSYTANTWVAAVQIRQKVAHRRTFYYLEQLILKHNAHKNTVTIEEDHQGLDFFYSERKHAIKMVEFLSGIVPVKVKSSEEFISQDSHTSKKVFKYTYFVEIVPICKEDLVVLPKRVAKSQGFESNRLVLCSKIASTVHFMDPTTLKTTEITAANFWKSPFSSLASSKSMTEYMVLDVEPIGEGEGNLMLADITVARSADLGVNDTTYYVRSHLGRILHPGDNVLGYHLVNVNYNHELWEELDKDRVPEVVLVKKAYPVTAKRNKGRNWKLKRMANEHNAAEALRDSQAAQSRRREEAGIERQNRDYEEFLQELEEDGELRREVDLYKRYVPEEQDEQDEEEEDDNDDLPQIDMSELKIDNEEEDDIDEFTRRHSAESRD